MLAAEGGAVVQAYRSTSYGTCLRVLHTDGSASLYAHLQYAYVCPGEVVEAGQLLGAAGAAGALREHTCILNCTGREQPVTRRMRWAFPHEAA